MRAMSESRWSQRATGMSLTGRIRSFFALNPHEELTYEQMAVKFDCSIKDAQTVVSVLAKEKQIERVCVIRSSQQQE